MNIESVIIHEIIKNEKVTEATLFLSDSIVDHTDKQIQEMIKSLDLSFSKKTLRRAKFSEDGFKKIIGDFKQIDLLDKSKELTKTLKDGVQNIPAAKGGYLIFCKYTNNKNFLAVFLVRDTKGSFLKPKDDNSWDVKLTEYLDVEHFAMGAKINLDTLNSDSEDRYISLVKGNTDISVYFENWIGLEDTKQETKDADALYNLSNNIPLPTGTDDRDIFKKKIFDYAKGRSPNSVNLRDLSKHLYDNENTIQEYCDENNIDIDGEFKLSGKQLSRFYKVSVKAGGIELSAPRSSFSPEGIEVSPDGKSILIHSQQLAEEITKTLKE